MEVSKQREEETRVFLPGNVQGQDAWVEKEVSYEWKGPRKYFPSGSPGNRESTISRFKSKLT